MPMPDTAALEAPVHVFEPLAEAEEPLPDELGRMSDATGARNVRGRGDQNMPVSNQPPEHKAAFPLPSDPQGKVHLVFDQIEVRWEAFR